YLFKPLDKKVDGTRPDDVAAGVNKRYFAEARQERPREHYRGAQGLGKRLVKLVGRRGTRVDLVGVRPPPLYRGAQRAQHLGHARNVLDVGRVVYDYRPVKQKRRRERLEDRVFGAAHGDGAAQRAP